MACDIATTPAAIIFGTKHARRKSRPTPRKRKKIVEEIVKILKTPEIALQLSKVATENNDQNVTNATIISAINDLSEIWEYLYTAEQHKIARLLIDEANVSSDGIMVRISTEEVGQLNTSNKKTDKINGILTNALYNRTV